jgi:GTP cyclohydrolase I
MFEKILEFELALARYTGSPYAIMTDCCTHAIELCLRYKQVKKTKFTAYTYLSIPMTMHKLGIDYELVPEKWIGEYRFHGTDIWDSARMLEPNMYRAGQMQCLSFGHNKPLQIGHGGAILLDDKDAYGILLRQRYDGRDLKIPSWEVQRTFMVGYHYRPAIEDAEIGLEKLPAVNHQPKYHPYPDLRDITIIGDSMTYDKIYVSNDEANDEVPVIIQNKKTSTVLRQIMEAQGKRFWAGDNISEFITPDVKERLINEATQAFEGVLDTLLIDRKNDPNSKGTARRLAKMYFNEIMAGRYEDAPDCTAFPNDSEDRYEGMLVVRSELRSMCSHHHQPVSGVAYIGIIAAQKLIGLSKYTRIAQWCARRGTLQEELCNDIAKEIMKATDSANVGVYIQAQHGCCENRGIMAHSSLTQTTVLRGVFQTDPGTKKEFMDNIKLQQDFAPR